MTRGDALTRYTESVGTRLTADQRDALDRLVAEGRYASESELVREAIDRLLQGEEPDFGVGDASKTAKRVVVEMPGATYRLLEELVGLEVILSPQDGIRQAIRPYVDLVLELNEEDKLKIKSHKKRQMEEKYRESSVNIPR